MIDERRATIRRRMTRTSIFLSLLFAGPMLLQFTGAAAPEADAPLRRFGVSTAVPWLAILWLAPGLLLSLIHI